MPLYTWLGLPAKTSCLKFSGSRSYNRTNDKDLQSCEVGHTRFVPLCGHFLLFMSRQQLLLSSSEQVLGDNEELSNLQGKAWCSHYCHIAVVADVERMLRSPEQWFGIERTFGPTNEYKGCESSKFLSRGSNEIMTCMPDVETQRSCL